MTQSLENQYEKAAERSVEMGAQPFNRDSISLAFGPNAKHAPAKKRSGDGQRLAGSGALVFEGESLDMPLWH